MSDTSTPFPISLTLARVNFGGNASRGKYFFDFSSDPVLVQQVNMMLIFSLSPDTPSEIVIVDVVSSDARGQLGPAKIGDFGRTATVQVANTVPYILQVALILQDEKTGETIVCDPQVICRPPPHAGTGNG